jgi:hypothetical protein
LGQYCIKKRRQGGGARVRHEPAAERERRERKRAEKKL